MQKKTGLFDKYGNNKPSKSLNFVFIFIVASILITTLWYSRILINKVSQDERLKVKNWATAVQRKAAMVNYIRVFFSKLELEERKYATVWSYAYKRLLSNQLSSSSTEEFEIYMKIINDNKNIPFLLVDNSGRIVDGEDARLNFNQKNYFRGTIKSSYMENPPIAVRVGKEQMNFYYQQSQLFEDLKDHLANLSQSFLQEITENSVSVPVIITDSTFTRVLDYGNLDDAIFSSPARIQAQIAKARRENPPIEINVMGKDKIYIFYESSPLLYRLNFVPFALTISMLILMLSMVYVYYLTEKSERNQVWLGMSKETAHQLGTPISSLIAWIEYLKLKREDVVRLEDLMEMEKDIERLQIIAKRFSKIGSVPEYKSENVVAVIHRCVSYLQARTSAKIHFHINRSANEVVLVPLNTFLFEWVIENLCKNAVDAIGEKEGDIMILISQTEKTVMIDVQDTGKGLHKNLFKKVFNTGFTTKKRGWGVGLTLAKRIVEEYHKGRIFVSSSTLGVGTIFRILLQKDR